MLMNLHKHVWTEALQMSDFRQEGVRNGERLKRLVGLADGYERRVKEETELTKDQLKTRYVGKVDPKKPLCVSISPVALTYRIGGNTDIEDVGMQLIEDNIVSVSRQMIDKEASVPKARDEKAQPTNGAMDVDEDL
ncbi:multicatalytic endopeptidase [Cryomyces antarcticus]|uniref:Multicatalytic endopeptidase n=1 Tax=Cryomyces antarcticus TaxID=329879 RepID=A0ABR0LV96_9PEZI|nr:multicatalytic endopeptidase [Cryomyces antarcticus]